MDVAIDLARPLHLTELAALLPALLQLEQVAINGTGDRLICGSAEGDPAFRERGLARELDRVGVDWQLRDAPSAAPVFTLARDVLTVRGRDARELALPLIEKLAARGAGLRATRCLTSPAAREAAFELYVDRVDPDEAVREQLRRLGDQWGVDVALMPSDLKRPRRRFLAFDMDSTLIRCEVIDELALRAGVGEAVAAVTARAMRGELDFSSSFRERLARLRGLPGSVLDEIAQSLPIMDGAPQLFRTLRAQGHYTAILSGGFDFFARRVQQQLGIDEVHSNHLQLRDGTVTGAVDGPIVDGERKVSLLRGLAAAQGFALEDTVAVGDGANDLPMLAAAGLGIAFHAKPVVRERSAVAMSHSDLTGVLSLLGVADPVS